jgi:rhodanese-related sulfurtransferase
LKKQQTIIDVRTTGEFLGGHAPGSINIPLPEIYLKTKLIMEMQQPILLCCASGIRSSQAAAFLKSQGIECENRGCWLDVN